jgi:hypothetical protein
MDGDVIDPRAATEAKHFIDPHAAARGESRLGGGVVEKQRAALSFGGNAQLLS